MTFLSLFLTFFKIGLFTFGGGYAMLPLIQSEVVGHGWISAGSLVDFIAISESTPGPFAVNIATYVGNEVGGRGMGLAGGLFGGFCATLGVALPSFLIILLVAKGIERFRESRIVNGCMSGLKPAVIGLIGTAILSIGGTVFFPNGISRSVFSAPSFYLSAAIFAVMLILAFRKVHPILIICLSALIGILAGFCLPFPIL